MTDDVSLAPVAEVLAGLEINELPGNAPAKALFALIKYEDGDGDQAWAVRVTDDLPDDELLGALTGYVEHLKRVSAEGWRDHDTTRPV
jgi:hypothetical protein